MVIVVKYWRLQWYVWAKGGVCMCVHMCAHVYAMYVHVYAMYVHIDVHICVHMYVHVGV